ncbi:MAG: hypothetical protein ABIB71_04805 [Candidatus Woesearchaeota archaeon]
MFIRIKTRTNSSGKQYSYAYLVRNKWKGITSKQSVRKYLGRALKFPGENTVEEIKEAKALKGMLSSLIANELKKRGFERSNNLFQKDNVEVDISLLTVRKGKFPAVIEINEGFMCDYTFRRLFNYRLKGKDAMAVGKGFAQRLIASGLKVEQELFVDIFNRFYRKA